MNAPCILVIDDNPTNLKLASDVLALEGYAILQAADAEIALTVIDSHDIDLILMDIALPEMDGLTLTRLLKSRENQKRIKIVALTAFAMMGDDAKAMSAGCDGYITKPINTRTFGAQVRAILSRTEAAIEKESA
jgi:CheY-like chemotaxis protein